MPVAAASSNLRDLSAAIDEACRQVSLALAGAASDLTCVFVSHHHADEFDRVAREVRAAIPSRVLLGCTGEGIVAGGREYETGPAISLWSAALPTATLTPFALTFERTRDGIVCEGWPEGLSASEARAVLLLGDPYSSAPQTIIDYLQDELPGVPIVGGMASAARPGENRLFLQDAALPAGAVGVIVGGDVALKTIVSQGCRPIGTPFIVTDVNQNIVLALGGVPPLRRLETMYRDLPDRDRSLIEHGLHLGIAMDEYRDKFERGDFLISNVLGADQSTGAIAIGSLVRRGQTVQFHLRDAETADDDLNFMLQQYRTTRDVVPQGALLFSCNGRGVGLFQAPDHDASTAQRRIGPLPLAGFFAQGEFGPVGSKNYLHGFTASLLVFE